MKPELITEYQPHIASEEAWQRFLKMRDMNAHDEAWKYTRLAPLHNAFFPPQQPVSVTEKKHEKATEIVLSAGIVVYHDDLPSGVSLEPVATLHFEAKDPGFQQQLALNHAVQSQAWQLKIKRGTVLEKPILFRFENHAETQSGAYTRLSVIIEEGAAAQFIEEHVSEIKTQQLHHQMMQIHLKKDASLKHDILQAQSQQVYHLGAIEIIQDKNSQYEQFLLATGAGTMRHEVHGRLQEAQARCDVKGLLLARDQQQMDCYLPIYHNAPNTSSNQHYRTVLDDQAQGIFFGKIIVPKDCQKIEAHQLSKHILLSEKAHGDARPELEIYADDVVCSHGAAIGQLDQKAIYYLRSRGLSEKQAKECLIAGFIQAMLDEEQPRLSSETMKKQVQYWVK